MRTIAFVLACSVCWGKQKTVEAMQRSSPGEQKYNLKDIVVPNREALSLAELEHFPSDGRGATSSPLNVLAKLFLSFSPTSGWQVHCGQDRANLAVNGHLRNRLAPRTAGRHDRCLRMAQPSAAPTLSVPVPWSPASRAISRIMASAAAAVDLQPPKTNKISRVLSGVFFSAIAALTVIGLYPLVLSAWLLGKVSDNSRRRASDFVVQLWARMTMTFFGAKIRVEGAEHLPPANEAVMYVPNHCSFLDIFSLSGYMPRRFKYISKIEILRIPLIGWAMGFAKHIAIARMDRKSQLKTLRDAVETLKAGNSLVTFPEGTRSKDGRLADFKKGPFTMAARAGVRVVPVTIIGTHLFQPPGAFVPYAIPRGVRIVVHPALDAPQPKKEDETLKAAKAAIESALPESMKPLTTAKA